MDCWFKNLLEIFVHCFSGRLQSWFNTKKCWNKVKINEIYFICLNHNLKALLFNPPAQAQRRAGWLHFLCKKNDTQRVESGTGKM